MDKAKELSENNPLIRNRSILDKFLSKYQQLHTQIDHIRGTTRFKIFLYQILERFSSPGDIEKLVDKEWDNAIILDACRSDMYNHYLGAEVGKRFTAGSRSPEFIERNFSEGDFSDVVYITANPFFSPDNFKELTGREVDEVFHEVFHTYRTDWSDKEKTVLPEEVVRDALTAKKLFPDKKKIVHFMQPHHPFVRRDLVDKGFGDILEDDNYTDEWKEMNKGKLSHSEVMEAYYDNLDFVFPHAEDLAEKFDGRTVITADHGNLCGEKGSYGHPGGKNFKKLREVPWHVYDESLCNFEDCSEYIDKERDYCREHQKRYNSFKETG